MLLLDWIQSIIYLVTEALSDSIKFRSAIQTNLSIYLSIWHKNTEYRRQYLDLAVFLHHLTFRALRILLLLLQLVTNLPVNFQHVLITTQ